jgi:hypothetical protein
MPPPPDSTPPDPEDPYRWCIHCRADCYENNAVHSADCPSTTGVFPITKKDATTCRHCGASEVDTSCHTCGAQFVVGDHYVLVNGEVPSGVPGIEGAYFAGTATCLGCAALRAIK